jgi:hypothetical protein
MNNNLEKEDEILSFFLKSIGPWKKYLIISGGFAPIIYKLYLSNDKNGILPVGTRDLDSLIQPNFVKDDIKELSQYLKNSGFKLIFKDLENPPAESYIKEIDGYELEVEFITSCNFRKYENKNLKIAGIVAQPLKYIELSFLNSIEFITHSHDKGLVVKPDVWIFHKGLTFTKRISYLKKMKDLYGIWYVSTQLGNFSKRAIGDVNNLAITHPKWFKRFQKNLFEWKEMASPIDWLKLESQDPYGKLGKINFLHLLKNWI